ncbi:sigma-54-dependent Fis family transcriptional regulator [Pseudonocardia asaccharolytica]|uniref:Fis family transcriptional regulator n=1 Tax=Pseudonocardia asaccharolytica DSM 44247 = NBRC 16224 TaxID=1123024 RepID=A0A511CY55_9PSEU|nr:helix-turn-helix domain-containing protein [Pseudonocardia asaccharolytica]GEL17499.1 Fis family transcriptional regulator [Pseudonocardia asaccharolytica DSM 44247 = NBRC 16224]
MSHPRPHHAGPQRLVAAAREGFLALDDVDTAAVRASILESWRRSMASSVAADRVAVRYAGSPNLEMPLVQSATPILEHLRDLLADEPVSIILTDPAGVVLSRSVDDAVLERHLDSVSLAPGFSYAEQDVGTNGIGTALTQNTALGVFGTEHFAAGLDQLACFGAPIHHPITRTTVGVLDLTCWNPDASVMLRTLATNTAYQIEDALLVASGRRELALLRHYTTVCQHTDRPVLATNNDVMMMNQAARTMLSVDDQTRLLDQAAEAIASGRPQRLSAELSDGTEVHVDCTPARTGGGRLAGCVLAVDLIAPVIGLAPRRRSRSLVLSGLAGSSPAWRKCCEDVIEAHASGEPLLLTGEAGVGKLSLAKAVHHLHRPGSFTRIFDTEAATTTEWFSAVAEALGSDGETVILPRLERLPETSAPPLAALLRSVLTGRPDAPPRLIVTAQTPQLPDPLRDLLHREVTVPPLRQRTHDLNEIIGALLRRIRPRGVLRCSSQARNILLRGRWPGNVAELLGALTTAARRCQGGMIEPEDLPPRCRAVARRLLTPLESLERDAIINSLRAADGDKADAARTLQISRATIYRKIRRYGIDLCEE